MSWAIIGLGWLGSALSEQLKLQGIDTWGTHRTDLDLMKNELPSRSHDVLFLNTPPLLNLAPIAYARKIAQTSANQVIFISSTSVFGSSQKTVDETCIPAPDTLVGQWLIESEQALNHQLGSRLQVIRPGGLIGGQRHPVRQLSGRKGIAGGLDRINMIHRNDLISLVINAPREISVLHAVANHHPTRAAFYAQWSQKLSLVAPEFINEETSKRIIYSRYSDELIVWQCRELNWL